MLYGLPQTTGRVLLGAVGVVALAAGANAVSILAEAVRRAVVQSLDYARGIKDRPVKPDQRHPSSIDENGLRAFLPYSRTATWGALGYAALKNLIVATAGLYLLNKFCPSTVVNANKLLHQTFIPLQFTPNNIPFVKLFDR